MKHGPGGCTLNPEWVRPGHRKQGQLHFLIAGVADYARSCQAPVIEAYPVDNRGQRVDLTMAYVGTRVFFDKTGFQVAGKTSAIIRGFPRMIMGKEL